MPQVNELLSRIQDDPYNKIRAFSLPDGGIAIVLSHRITDDHATMIRIIKDNDVRFFDAPEDEEALERVNQRGPWNILCDHKIHFGPGHMSSDTCRLPLGHDSEHEDSYGHTWYTEDERNGDYWLYGWGD